MNVLVLNAGSGSLKFDIIDAEPANRNQGVQFGQSLVAGAYDNIGKPEGLFQFSGAGESGKSEQLEVRDHGHAAELLLKWIEDGGGKAQGIAALKDIARIGHRVVHGGDIFKGPVEVSGQVIEQIEGLADLAPLHNDSALAVIKAARAAAGSSMLMIAVFDTVFHRTIPDEAALYALPPDLAQRHKIRRYGFHGTSHRYMMLRYAQIVKRPISELKLVTLHLEGGSSAAAIHNGRSIDTSMGLTPLEGLIMGTRCGDLDPAIVTFLMRKEGWDGAEVEKFLNKKCGLLGVSGKSGDTRELLKHMDEPRVRLTIEMFALRVRKYIGAYLAELCGADAILFGGGIGENTAYVRERIATGFEWCGATLDRNLNNETVDREGAITTPESPLQIWVVPTREGLMIAHDVANFQS